jgi:hypothetical protein
MPDRQPQPSDLLGARQIADEHGIPLRTAENILRVVAREHGGPITVKGVRRIFVRREWVDASIGQRAS